MRKPKVENVTGLSPAISIEQQTTGQSPRSTVGTVTEIYDYLRILYARLGQPYCPACGIPIDTQTADQIIDKIHNLPEGTRLNLLARGSHGGQSTTCSASVQFRDFSGSASTADLPVKEVPHIDHRRKHAVEIVDRADRSIPSPRRGRRPIETALDLGRGVIYVAHVDDPPEDEWKVERFSLHFACHHCGRSFESSLPTFFLQQPARLVPICEGLGTEQGTEPRRADSRTPNGRSRRGRLPPGPTRAESAVCQDARRLGQAVQNPARRPLRATRADPAAVGAAWHRRPLDHRRQKMGDWKFQYKGLFPAIEESSRVSYAYRQKLHELVGEVPCSWCGGSRLRADAAAVRFLDRTIHQLCSLPLDETLAFLKGIPLSAAQKKVAGDLVNEATSRLGFLVDVGLDYLTLARPLPTLSGGETQRIRLAGQIGRGLTGVLYVLDEPTIGLHPRDNDRLLEALRRLRELGNTVVMVEHDREVIRGRRPALRFRPGCRRFGGTITAQERRRPSRGRPHRSPDNIFRAAKKSRFRQAAASRPTPTFRRAAAGSS